MELGAFSISLPVANIEKSYDFYTKLGFTQFGGSIAEKWVIMRNNQIVIGLFEGMLEKNCLIFNPGWDQAAQPQEVFTDIREIEKALEDQGIALTAKVAPNTKGPGSFTLTDPDGNMLLFDQHV